MKKDIFKRSFAFVVSFLMIASIFVLPTFAENAETGTEAVEKENVEPYVILTAEDMKDNISGESKYTSYSFEKEGNVEFLRLNVKEDGNDPYAAYFPEEDYSADDYKYVSVLVRSDIHNNSTAFSLYYGTEGNGNTFAQHSRVSTLYKKMSDWQFVVYDLSSTDNWSGKIEKIRFDFLESAAGFTVGNYTDVAALILSTNVESIYDAGYDIMTRLYPPVQTISDFTEADLPHVSGSPTNTVVTVVDGNLIYMGTGTMKDPSAWLYYANLAQARGIRELSTFDFRYTVIRYRTTMNFVDTSMELFILTGSAKSLMDMIRIENSYSCHSGSARYSLSRTWRGVMVDMADDDGLEQNTKLKYGWQGRGKFTGFRFDWCGTAAENAYMEISDFMFYSNEQAAKTVSNAISTINIAVPIYVGDDEERETEKIIMPWETETETLTEEETVPVFSEETLPVFTEDTEEQVTETLTEIGSEDITETEEPIETETETLTETEIENSGNNGQSSGGNIGEIPLGGEEEPVETGSEMPFYIACGALAGLSLASIATVVVIRIKCKA